MQLFFDNALLSREESKSIKGLLIILIVLGHTIPFIRLTDSWMIMVWLYLFHIGSFFLLPCLYPQKKLSFERIVDYFVRFYVPFAWLFFPLLLLNIVLEDRTFNLYDCVLAFVGGGAIHLRNIIKVQFPWFLVAMFFASIVREGFAMASSGLRKVLICIGLLSLSFAFCPLGNQDWFAWLHYVVLAFRFLVIGIAVRFSIEKEWFGVPILAGVFLLGSFCFFLHYRYCLRPFYYGYPSRSIHVFLQMVMAPTFLMLLWRARSFLARSKALVFLGEHSLPIYLSHAFIGYAVNWAMLRLGVNYFLGTPLCYGIMVIVASLFAIGLEALGRFKALFIPRGWLDFKKALFFWKKI